MVTRKTGDSSSAAAEDFFCQFWVGASTAHCDRHSRYSIESMARPVNGIQLLYVVDSVAGDPGYAESFGDERRRYNFSLCVQMSGEPNYPWTSAP
jgi:hypothetical protein